MIKRNPVVSILYQNVKPGWLALLLRYLCHLYSHEEKLLWKSLQYSENIPHNKENITRPWFLVSVIMSLTCEMWDVFCEFWKNSNMSLQVWTVFSGIAVGLSLVLNWFNSLWPSHTIWQHGSGSTLVQVMACCLMTPSHYLNQCWLTMSKVLWHSSEGIIMGRSAHTNQWNKIENYMFRIAFRSHRGQWVDSWTIHVMAV